MLDAFKLLKILSLVDLEKFNNFIIQIEYVSFLKKGIYTLF